MSGVASPLAFCSRIAFKATLGIAALAIMFFCASPPLSMRTLIVLLHICFWSAQVLNAAAMVLSLIGWRLSEQNFPWFVAPVGLLIMILGAACIYVNT